MKYVKKTLIELYKEIIYFLKLIFKNICNILLFINPFLFLFLMNKFNNKYLFILPIVIYFLSVFFRTLNRKIYGSEEIPVYKRRFTRKEMEVVLFNMNDLYEMTSYLYEVENYFEKKGYYKNEKK